MRKIFLFLLIALMGASQVHAAEGSIAEGMVAKVKRGAVNLVTGIVEVPVQIKKGYVNGVGFIENEGASKTVGTVLGFFRGFSHAGGRMFSGASDLFGFWAASPETNEGYGTPLDAEYAWEEGERYDIFDPNLGEGFVKPVGMKLGRGLANAFLGIAEVPGQIKKGAAEGEVLVGTVRGFWYFFSREASGFSSIYTALLPGPKDTVGSTFNTEWPWESLTE